MLPGFGNAYPHPHTLLSIKSDLIFNFFLIYIFITDGYHRNKILIEAKLSVFEKPGGVLCSREIRGGRSAKQNSTGWGSLAMAEYYARTEGSSKKWNASCTHAALVVQFGLFTEKK